LAAASPGILRPREHPSIGADPNPALTGIEEMLRKIFLCVSVALLLAAMVWATDDPWKAKPYQQWDAKDVRKVLDASPWARTVQVPAPWISGGDAGAADNGGASSRPGPMGSGQTQRPGANGAADVGAGAQTVATVTFVVRWASSRTVREALLRGAILAGQITEDAAAQQLAQPVETYEIVLTAPDMKPFQSVDEKILEHGAFLMDRKTKEKVAPTAVKIQSSEDGKKIQSVAFFFPKKSDSGVSTIGADMKVVDFQCVVTNVKIEASFDTSKMSDTLGRDL
jgi:hypothetical protein